MGERGLTPFPILPGQTIGIKKLSTLSESKVYSLHFQSVEKKLQFCNYFIVDKQDNVWYNKDTEREVINMKIQKILTVKLPRRTKQ